MKRYLLLTCFILCLHISGKSQYVSIPDPQFRAYLDTAYASCMFNHMLDTTCPAVKNARDMTIRRILVNSLEGIQYFKNLYRLEVSDIYAHDFYVPELPKALYTIEFSVTGLTHLPPLPKTLRNLLVQSNRLTSIPPLPDSIIWFNCAQNSISELPALPNSITEMDAFLNKLSVLPKLPDSIRRLNVYGNYLTALPPLPKTITFLTINYNRLTELPSLPKLSILYADNNPLKCLPILPYYLSILTLKNTNIACQPNFINPNTMVDTILPHCPNWSYACAVNPYVKGRIYQDDNNNGIFDSLTEVLLPEYIVNVEPSHWVGASDSSGTYIVKLDTMVTNIWSITTNRYASITPTDRSLNPENTLGMVNGTYDFGIHFLQNVYDLQSHLAAGNAQPGFTTNLTVNIKNSGSANQNDVTVKLKKPASFSLSNAGFAPSFISGDTIIWNNISINAEQNFSIPIYFQVPVSDTLGTNFSYELWANGIHGDTTPPDNHIIWNDVIRGSYDRMISW